MEVIKKYILILILLFVSFNVKAFSIYNYNYEINSVDFNGSSGKIVGWAILNAGCNEGISPRHDSNLDSTSSNSYKYTLHLYQIDGNEKKLKVIDFEPTKIKGTDVIHRALQDSSVGSGGNPTYKNVYFEFDFSVSGFSDPSKYKKIADGNAAGYLFELTVKSTNGECAKNESFKSSARNKTLSCSQTFELSFYEESISTNAKKYFDSGTYLKEMKFVANNANVRSTFDKSVSGTCRSGSKYKLNSGGTYNVSSRSACGNESSGYMYNYKIKIGNSYYYAPANWLAPKEGNPTIITTDVCSVDGKKIKFPAKVYGEDKEACIAKYPYVNETTASCTTAGNQTYYTVTCQDHISTDFITSKTKYYKGDDFDIEANIEGYIECTGTFEHDKWIKHYNNGDAATKTRLISILENFKSFETNAYNLTSLNANIEYAVSKTKNNTVSFSSFTQEVISEGTKKIIYSSDKVDGKTIPTGFNYTSNNVKAKASLVTPIKVDNEKGSTDYRVTVQNAGYSNNSKIIFKCAIEKIETIYRHIDSANPFISLDRITGENWLNEKYDFRNIIKQNIEESNYEYVFEVSQPNIRAINKNTIGLGPRAYSGFDCRKFDANNILTCDMLRNTNLFEKIKIRGKTYK